MQKTICYDGDDLASIAKAISALSAEIFSIVTGEESSRGEDKYEKFKSSKKDELERVRVANRGTGRAGWRIPKWLEAVSMSRSKYYDLPTEQRPATVKLGKVQIIIESPTDYVRRMALQQSTNSPGASKP